MRRGPIALYSPPGVKDGGTDLWWGWAGFAGWLGLVEFGVVDRPRSRATDGHSVNATRKTPNCGEGLGIKKTS